ncbi:SUMF1/EgtB/PvdO family nonheme iron enzyme [Allohahella marinimesophila]|uniref:Ergothioneine biosynthesis protein EgtB n=1 Tax=Allohahella marinimesophila TaxID=1054972 RepID=A0ABP7NH84_9GAMM
MNSREALIQALDLTHQRIESLVSELSDEQRAVPYHSGINPPVWELGHSAFFYEFFLLMALDGVSSFDPSMDEVWDSFELDHADRWSPSLFPPYLATLDYVRHVQRQVMTRLFEKPLTSNDHYLYRYAICHQNMHIESMIWARQTLALPTPPAPPEEPNLSHTDTGDTANAVGDTDIRGGYFLIGLPGDSSEFARRDFGFDCEQPGFRAVISDFSISRTLVTCGDFLAFVEDGGYDRPEFWSQGGRGWLRNAQKRPIAAEWHAQQARYIHQQGDIPADAPPRHPQYWRKRASRDGWEVRHFDQWLPLEPSHPVLHIAYWEAEAWCAWAGRRLPTELEWEAAALDNRPGQDFQLLPWERTGVSDGSPEDFASLADMDARALGRLPATALPAGASPSGCLQMIGTCWEWTSSQFLPYDGFRMDMYPYMSTLQFGTHKTTRGGSCATSSLLIRGTYRQAYLPDRFDVFTGFRSCALNPSRQT